MSISFDGRKSIVPGSIGQGVSPALELKVHLDGDVTVFRGARRRRSVQKTEPQVSGDISLE
jgi:hypothetical protein